MTLYSCLSSRCIETDPGIYDNYKCQVNDYGETRVYKRDCGHLVPKSVDTSKTDWSPLWKLTSSHERLRSLKGSFFLGGMLASGFQERESEI